MSPRLRFKDKHKIALALILMDIGLPKLDGIEAAKRISELAPKSKILFFSQESSADIVQAAFSAGASGYVVKMDA